MSATVGAYGNLSTVGVYYSYAGVIMSLKGFGLATCNVEGIRGESVGLRV